MENTFSQTREELLLKTIYRKQPRAFDEGKGGCTYLHSVNGGCAIGCDLPEELAKQLWNAPISDIMEDLPERLQNMGEFFLKSVQGLHDFTDNWINSETAEINPFTGLVWSHFGMEKIDKIIESFELNIIREDNQFRIIENV